MQDFPSPWGRGGDVGWGPVSMCLEFGVSGSLRVGDTGWGAGPPGSHRQGPHHAIIPGDIVEGFTVV